MFSKHKKIAATGYNDIKVSDYISPKNELSGSSSESQQSSDSNKYMGSNKKYK